MDIRIVIKNVLVYLTTLCIILGIGLLVFLFINIYFIEGTFDYSRVAIGFFLFAVCLPLFHFLITWIDKLFSTKIFKKFYTTQETIKHLSNETVKVIELNKLTDLIVDTVMKSMGLNRTGILLAEEMVDKENEDHHHHSFDIVERFKRKRERHVNFYRIAKTIGFNETNGISLVKDNFLTSYLQKTKSALVFEELELMIRDTNSEVEKRHLQTLRENMQKIEAGVCLPLFSNKELIGLIVLGNKISNEAYTKEDLQLLETLANQASVAISNARLYKEVDEAHKQAENFNVILQKKVDEATKELKEKNANLQELLHMKSEFLTVASHQLRTPTSIVRGMLSMLNEDGDNMEPAQKKQFIAQSYESITHLERIVHDLLSATELEGGKMLFMQEPIHLEESVENIIKERKQNADKKDLKVEIKIPKNLPLAMADHYKVEEIVGNLFDNAVNYTEKGGITISLGSDKKSVWMKVADTGFGITKEDKKHLFERFKRGKDIAQVHPNGSGLGLYIVKGIVEGFKGQIKVESAGRNKGTTFTVYFPKALSNNNK
ncbi:MAG: GAF domain-containing sensor histidine kinase [Patescibacteria group bacterium]